MLVGSIPSKFSIPFANSAGGGFTRPIPTASQIGIQAGAASLTDGFPPVCFLPIGTGGTPPWGADFNGILNQITAWNQWQQAGAPIPYDNTFSGQIGGYPRGAVVPSAITFGNYWLSTVDNNTSNPDTGGSGWQAVSLNGGTQTTGDWKWRPTQEVLPGWTKGNGTTIGNAASGATQFADAGALNQFMWLWNNFSNTLCPVSSGRGANAAADFAANKRIGTLPMQGITPLGMDTMDGAPTTLLSGVPVTLGSATQAGSILGENLHTLLLAELAAHNHGTTDPGHGHAYSDPQHNHAIPSLSGTITSTSPIVPNGSISYVNIGSSGASTGASSINISITHNTTGLTVNSNGSNVAHNTVQLGMTGTHYFKL